MAFPNATFIFGLIVLFYLATFVFFAVLRILTGVSIQRIGYLSFRRLAYSPCHEVKIDIRGLGINLHRPTFSQPTWMSIVVTELTVVVDASILRSIQPAELATQHTRLSRGENEEFRSAATPASLRRTWDKLVQLKTGLQKLHRNIWWIRLVDVVATNCTFRLSEIGTLQIGNCTVAVDTRQQVVDRGRLFRHQRIMREHHQSAEWMVTLRSVLFTPEGKESLEILDHATLNVHGLLHQKLDGLLDVAVALKLGRVRVPVDDVHACIQQISDALEVKDPLLEHRAHGKNPHQAEGGDASPPDRKDDISATSSEGGKFVASILRDIKEFQFAVSYVGLTAQTQDLGPLQSKVYINASLKELGIDIHRLEPLSPAHRMYFSSRDIAHQALVAALSIAVGVDDGQGTPSRVLYVPMATTTIRTTLPARIIKHAGSQSADERNANLLFANIVVTSPSLDMDPEHLPLLLALTRMKMGSRTSAAYTSRMAFTSLLPKSNIKISLHEPVIRVSLPPTGSTDDGNFDLIISSISSISLELDSSHSISSQETDFHYAITTNLRLQSHNLYYQTFSNERYDLLQAELLELKLQTNLTSEVHVVASGTLQTFSVRMVRPEISDGVQEIIRQMHGSAFSRTKVQDRTTNPNVVRSIPPWLVHFQFQAYDFSAEVAGIDKEISEASRGFVLQLESWTTEYRAQRLPSIERRSSRRRAGSRSSDTDVELLQNATHSSKKDNRARGDGRRFALHIRGLEGFVIEDTEIWEDEPFLMVPRSEIVLSTASDTHGSILSVTFHIRTLLVEYSLYRHYAIGVAASVIQQIFAPVLVDVHESNADDRPMSVKDYTRRTEMPQARSSSHDVAVTPTGQHKEVFSELITFDVRATLIQVKAKLPSDPQMMFQIYSLEAGRHRWSKPFLHTKLLRVYVEAPKIKNVWARIASVKMGRIDIRDHRHKSISGGFKDEQMIDVSTEAVRLAVPHQLVLHKVFDNIVNTVKSVEQLHHRFKSGTNDYILEKHPEGPKHVPKISIRAKALLFELEDGAFEWKLGSIYRNGLVEQQQRMAREDAFRVKARKIEEEEQQQQRWRGSSRFRNKSTRRRNEEDDSQQPIHTNDGGQAPTRGRSPVRQPHAPMRYDPDGTCDVSGKARILTDEAWQRMMQYNAQSWKKRIDHSYAKQYSGMKNLRDVFWGSDQLPDDVQETEIILEIPQRPALLATLVNDLHIRIDKPSFPLHQLPDFLHRIGKGMPYDTKYTLLVPLFLQIDMGEIRMTLRDYPLPLLHVPALRASQSVRLPSWSLKTDFVIAEEFRGPQSVRHVKVEVVPTKHPTPSSPQHGNFSIDVRRTVSPVKSYSDMTVDINTSLPTRITWGASYQPAIQDMMMVIEGFTKPQVDPSDRTGFWDKIRLSFHSRALISWKGEGDVHLMLKGTRDPYAVTGNGAGFLMCWRNNVRWSIWRENDPRKFMTVDSGDYILAVPDYSHQIHEKETSNRERDSTTSFDHHPKGAMFKKVVMKLSGNVQWQAGLVFERSTEDGTRSFDFKPHYEIILREPSFAKRNQGQPYDAYRGFRSDHIHMSIAVKAPMNHDWSSATSVRSRSYNTVHLTPRFFTHFFAWWSMFSGTMSLPIRQGRLWPGIEKSSKKFGRHLATIKYNLLLAPLFLSHIYKHKEAEDYSDDVVSATGLKIRLDSFMLDMHQRREEFMTQEKTRKPQGKSTGMKIHKAQLDLVSADIRAVSASIAGTTTHDLQKATSIRPSSQKGTTMTDLSRFTIPDNDLSWIDMDDFVELDWILPSESNPQTKIMPLAFAPRFTYFRQTDHGDSVSNESIRHSPFGHEPSHYCVMSKDNDPRKIQCQLIQERIDQLSVQEEQYKRTLGEAELQFIRDNGKDASLKTDYETLRAFEDRLRDKHLFLESMLRRMAARIKTNDRRAVPDGDADRDSDGETPSHASEPETEGTDTTPPADFVSNFNNRFVIHNMQLKWNNSLRNTILRYIHQVSQRRGFVYYQSRRAVKFILDIVEEQHKSRHSDPQQDQARRTTDGSLFTEDTRNVEEDVETDVEDRIRDLLADAKKFVSADDPDGHGSTAKVSGDNIASSVGKGFTAQNSYHLRLIAPQIQLQSDKNPRSVSLVTAKGMELKVIEVMDRARVLDDVSGLVQRRFSVAMDSTQFFVAHQQAFTTRLLAMYSGNRYGTSATSAWPPWVPMEVMFDFELNPFGFKRVVQRTSASLRYDKYNTLRLKYNDEIGNAAENTASPENIENRMDHLWVEFPYVRAICDSSQYFALYIIVLDLLLYSEPLEKTRTERLEKIMLASDFSDLSGAPEMVIRLQERIRQLEDIKTQFQIRARSLDSKGWEDRIMLEQDLASCEDELFFMMKAITTSQRKYDESQNNGLLRWNISSKQIVWHLMREEDQPLMEFQLKHAEYDRTDNSDGSHVNLMQVGKIVGLNLLPNAIYPEIIAPFVETDRRVFNEDGHQQMLRIYWYMLEAIAGIPVMDHFEVNLFPMKIQLEREVGKKLFEYIFPESADKNDGSRTRARMADASHSGQDENLNTERQNLDSPISENFGQTSSPETRAGSLELRLQPTLNSETQSEKTRSKSGMGHFAQADSSHARLFPSSSAAASRKAISSSAPSRKPSNDSLHSHSGRIVAPSRALPKKSSADVTPVSSEGKTKRFGLHRSGKPNHENEESPDDLTKMISRASNYMTLAYIKVPSVVLCLSYKGKGERNIEDVHNFVFRMPALEYRNKTWSNLDLALALKKDVIRALISHTGAIIGNKFSKHRPTTAQQSRLRDLVSSSVAIPTSKQESSEYSDTSSILESSSTETYSSDVSHSPRHSAHSVKDTLTRSVSSSSVGSSMSRQRKSHQSTLSMTATKPTHGHAVSESLSDLHSAVPANGNADHSRSGGFMTDTKLGRTINAFSGRMRDRHDSPSPNLSSETDTREPHRTKGKSISRKILGKQ